MTFTRARAAVLACGTLGVTVAYLACAWALVFQLRVGPVAMTVDASAGHGVHTGDLLALPLIGLACWSFVFAVGFLDQAARPRMRTPWRLQQPVVTVTPVVTVPVMAVRTRPRRYASSAAAAA